jgi:hypothetical protein
MPSARADFSAGPNIAVAAAAEANAKNERRLVVSNMCGFLLMRQALVRQPVGAHRIMHNGCVNLYRNLYQWLHSLRGAFS